MRLEGNQRNSEVGGCDTAGAAGLAALLLVCSTAAPPRVSLRDGRRCVAAAELHCCALASSSLNPACRCIRRVPTLPPLLLGVSPLSAAAQDAPTRMQQHTHIQTRSASIHAAERGEEDQGARE